MDPLAAEPLYTEGVGLKNVKQRLELAYKGKYNLVLDAGEGYFSVLLEMDLLD